jgi:hypothetical protein
MRQRAVGRFFLEEILGDRDDALDLRVGQFRENRPAEAFARGFFSDGKITGFVAGAGLALLPVQRQRIMQRATDAVAAAFSLSPGARRG